jgi:hypothetical protein
VASVGERIAERVLLVRTDGKGKFGIPKLDRRIMGRRLD